LIFLWKNDGLVTENIIKDGMGRFLEVLIKTNGL